MKDENEEIIEEIEDDFIDDYSDDYSDEEIIEYIEEKTINNNKINSNSESYNKSNNNINKPPIYTKRNITNSPSNVNNNGYTPNSIQNKKNNMDLKNAATTVASSMGKGTSSNGVPQALTDKKMNVSKVENTSNSSSKSETKEEKTEEKSEIKEKLDKKVNEAKNDTKAVAKGAAELAAGNKVQGIIDLAPVLLKKLKKKIILYASIFFISVFALAAIFFAILSPIQDALDKLNEFFDGVTEFSEKTNNMYSGLGFKTTEQAFFEELDSIYNDYFNEVNLALIMSALFYPENDNEYETDYSKTEETDDSFLSGASDLIKNHSEDEYTEGKILRARMLARGMTEEADGEKVTLEEFIRLYTEQMAKDSSDVAEALLGALLTKINPIARVIDVIKDTYNIFNPATFATNRENLTNSFSNILETATLGAKTVSSIDIEFGAEDENGNTKFLQIYVTMRIKAYNEEKFKQFLATKYIPKMPEFKRYIKDLTGTARDQEIERIVKEIYERESWYTNVYGMVEGNVENNDNTCVGAIDNDILTELTKPVEVGDSVSFDGEYAYGISNGKLHNGVDLNETTSGTKAGDNVFAVAQGKVIEVDMNISCNTSDDSTCSENGSYVALSHDISVNRTSYTFVTLYANLQSGSNSLKVGDTVKKGAKIGIVGKTGNSKVAQLHFAFLKGQTLSGGTPIDPSNLFISCNTGDLSGGDNQEKIWFYFRNLGYSEAATAGAMGNMGTETGGTYDPRIVQGDIPFSQFSIDYTNKVDSGKISKNDFMRNGPNGGGYGLVQFTYYTRKETLYDHAKETSTSIGDLKTQLETIMKEFEDWKKTQTYKTWKGCNSESEIDTATIEFMNGYEKPGTPHESERKKYAHEIYKRFHGKSAPSESSISSSSNSLISSAKKVKKYISSKGYRYGALGSKVENWKNSRTIDCSSYVSAVLYEMNDSKFLNWLKKNGGGQATSYTFEDNPFGYKVIKQKDVKPGDILVYSGHVEIYAGKEDGQIKVYNAGSNGAIKASGITNASRSISATTKILRP